MRKTFLKALLLSLAMVLLWHGEADAFVTALIISGAIVGGALVASGVLSVSFLWSTFAVSGMGLLGFAAGALGGAAIGGALAGMAKSVYQSLTMDSPDMVSVGTQSNTYSGPYPVVTVERGTPIPLARGKLRTAGNILRVSGPVETAYYKMIMGHCQGQSDTTVQYKSGTTFLAYFVNGVEWSRFTDPDHKFWSHSGSTYHKSGVSHLFDTEVSNFRGLTLTEFKFQKNTEDVKGVQNINVIGRFGRCLDIGEDSGGVRSFTRNPSQVLWDWYINKEGYTASQLNQDAFEVLEEYCDYVPPDSESVPVWPPGPSDLTVKATGYVTQTTGSLGEIVNWGNSFKPIHAFDKEASVTGGAATGCWWTLTTSNQRISVDLGAQYQVERVEIENYHTEGTLTARGINQFSVQGSNNLSSFEDTSYASTGWTDIHASWQTASQHTGADVSDPEMFDFSNSLLLTFYRYYSLKITSNYGATDGMGIRKIKLYGKSSRYTFDYNFDAQVTMNDAKKLIWKSFNGMCVMNQGQIKPVWDAAENCYGNATLLAKEDGDFLLKEDGDNILLERSQNKAISHRFTIDNIVRDSLSWSKPRRPNIVRVYYINSQDGFKKDSVEIRDESDIDAKGELLYEETCWWVTEPDVARRRARFKFDKARYTDYMCRLGGFPDSSPLEVLDRVKVSHPLPGWSGKDFLVMSKSEDTIGRPVFDLESYYAGLYHDRGYEIQETYGSRLPNPYGKLSGVTGVTLAEDAFFDNSGNWINKVKLTYTLDQNPFYSHSRVWLKAGSPGDGVAYGEYGIDTSGGANFIINNVKGKFSSGSTITVKVEGVSQAGMGSGTCPSKSVWASLPDIETEIAALTSDIRMILPRGTYTLPSGGVTMPSYNICLEGINREGVVIENTAGNPFFNIADVTKAYNFNHLTISSQNTSAFDTLFSISSGVTSENDLEVGFRDVSFNSLDRRNSPTGDAIIWMNCSGNKRGTLTILHCDFSGGRVAVQGENLHKLFVANNSFDKNYSAILYGSVGGKGIIQVDGNIIRNTTYAGIRIMSQTTSCYIRSNTFLTESNNVHQPGVEGLILDNVKNSQVINNSFRCSSTSTAFVYHAISCSALGGAVDKATISQNKIEVSGVSTSLRLGGVICSGVTDSIIDQNQIYIVNSGGTTNGYGIRLLGDSDHNQVTNNQITMNDRGKDIGIHISSGSGRNYGTDNRTYKVGTSIIDNGSNNTVTVTDY